MKRVFILHGWNGYPEDGWIPWLRVNLEQRGFAVMVPELPDPEVPRIFNWVPKLQEVAKQPDEQTYFIGQSLGGQTIARYLERLPEGVTVGGAVFVASFFKRLRGLETDIEVQKTHRHWLGTPVDFGKVRKALPKSVAIFSDDDPWVTLDNQDDFRDKLGSKIIIAPDRGHFKGKYDHIFEVPDILGAFLEIAE